MKKEKMRTVRNVVILAVLLLYAYYTRVFVHETNAHILTDTTLHLSRTMIHAGITIVWLISVKRRIIQKQVRNYLQAVGVLLLFWQYLKTSKWLFFVTADTITRYMWYAYYIPIILIPLFSFFIAESIGKPESYERPKWMGIFFIPAFLLICLILTNDFHRMVFDFPKGMEYASSHYTYQIVYYLTILWVLLLSFYTIFTLLRKCHVPGSRWFQRTPIFVIAGAILLWVIYYLKIVIYDITAFSCLVIILLLESCIQSGLIRSNTGYEGLFQASTIEAQISDMDFHVCYRSDQAQAVEKETLIHAVNEPVMLENKRLSSAQISNGHVFWMDDITELRHYMKELEKTGAELAEQNDLLKAELELQEKTLRTEEKNRLYDRITLEVSDQLKRIEKILAECSPESDIHDPLIYLCILSAYIKRRSNLLLISENNPDIPAKEMEYCLRESLDNLGMAGIPCSINSRCTGNIPAEYLVMAYDLFENALEQTLCELHALFIKLKISEGKFFLRLQMDCMTQIHLKEEEKWLSKGGKISLQNTDGILWIEFSMGKGGVTV
ncbi:MAG: histidine kinase N-terminal 7TM domain-containing protein [Muricoprocola sp.]